MKGRYEGKVIAFDFDGTITSKKCHSHNYLSSKKIHPITVKSGLVVNGDTGELKLQKKYDPEIVVKTFQLYLQETSDLLREPKKLLETIKELMKEGAKIAIVSFNQYLAVFKVALDKIGFTDEEIKKFDIINGFPVGEPDEVGKSEHLAKLKEITKIEKNEDIILIDDSYQNVKVAREEGYKAVYVMNDNYFEQLPYLLNNNNIPIFGGENILAESSEEDVNILDDISGEGKENKLNDSPNTLNLRKFDKKNKLNESTNIFMYIDDERSPIVKHHSITKITSMGETTNAELTNELENN